LTSCFNTCYEADATDPRLRHLSNMLIVLHNTEKDGGAPASATSLVDSCNTVTSNPTLALATGKRLLKYLMQQKGNKVRHRPRASSSIASQSNASLADGNPPGPSNRSQEAEADPASGGKRKIRKVAKACLYCERSHMTCNDR
jgi:hypothetical protein